MKLVHEKKTNTLGDYISFGKHEFVAFVKDTVSPNSSGHRTNGNNLGNIVMGVLICERESESKRDESKDWARFFHKRQPMYKEDSDIMFGDFDYSAQVDSKNPLAISTPFYNHYHLKARSKSFRAAKKLLEQQGLY